MTRMIIAIAIGLGMIANADVQGQDKAQNVYFEFPKEAKQEDISKAAKTIQARCESHGYKGITAKVIERGNTKNVVLSCDTGFTEAMMSVIKQLCRWPGRTIEFKAAYSLTQAEAEQYHNPGYDLKAKAPKGSYWCPTINADMGVIEFITLLKEKPPLATYKDLPRPKRDDLTKGLYYEMNATLRQKLTRDKDGWFLVIDGYALNERWDIEQRYEPSNIPGEMVLVPSILRPPFRESFLLIADNPMPFALNQVK